MYIKYKKLDWYSEQFLLFFQTANEMEGKSEAHPLITLQRHMSSLLKQDTLLTPVRACISAALWAKRKSGLVGEQWKIVLVGMALGATMLLLLQEIRSHEYELTLSRKQLVSETTDGHNTLYGYHDKHSRRIKKSLREKELERDQSRDRRNYRGKDSERYTEIHETANESVGRKSRRRFKENLDAERNGEEGGNKLQGTWSPQKY